MNLPPLKLGVASGQVGFTCLRIQRKALRNIAHGSLVVSSRDLKHALIVAYRSLSNGTK